MSEDDSTPSPPTEPLEQAAQGAASVAGAAAEAEDAPAAAEQAVRQAASAGVGVASAAVASEVPEEAQAVTAAATAAAQAAVTDPSSAASAAAGAGAQAGVGQAAQAAGVPAPLASAGTTMAQGAISQALAADESPESAAGAAGGAGAAGAGASSRASGGSDASHHAGFQAPDAASTAAAMAAELMGEDQGHVDAAFECTELDVFFDVLNVEWTERLDAPYEVRVRVSTDEIDTELGRMLGADCSVTLRRNDQEQRLVGICSEVVEGASSEHSTQAMLCIVPAFRLMELRRDSRIFQDKTVAEIVEEVLTESLGAFGRSFRAELDRTYPKCEYRVQYDETDYDFVQRLIEEEGIIYWFDHEGDTEEMVLVDDPERHPVIERPEGDTLEMLGFESGQGNLEVIREFHMRSQVKPTRLSLRNWDWTRAAMTEGDAEGEAPPPEELPHGALSGAPREEYEHDNRPLTFHEYSAPTFGENDLADQLRLRREVQSRDARVGQGKGTAVALRAGQRFVLAGHRAIELDGGYLLTKVVHRFSIDGTERYFNTFECLPEGVPFRPLRKRRKPRVAGMQTATVVGPADEEIHTDEHGRIMVQFHWDRQGNYDEHSTCFIRVMQAWAGPGWGFVFLPRIGMEVVVSFMGGDPDRPMVTGSVYNGANPPPYAMPDEKTKSTIKTSSSPGGDGYNELTFEDAAGDEQIIVHAQKDYNETVENDHSTTVHGSQTLSVDGNQTETVGADQTITVKKNQIETVKENVTIMVEGTREETVTGSETITLEDIRDTKITGTETITVTGAVTETFEDTRDTTVGKADTETVSTGDKNVTVTEGSLLATAKTAVQLSQTEANYLQLKDGAILRTDKDYTISNGKASIQSDGEKLAIKAPKEIVLQVGGVTITLTDQEVSVMGVSKAIMGTAGSTFTAEPAGATINGAKITSQAIGIHEVMGALVKIN